MPTLVVVAVGLVFHVMEHLGKLNIRGDHSLETAVKAATGAIFHLQQTTSKPLVSGTLSGLDPMNIYCCAKAVKKKRCMTH